METVEFSKKKCSYWALCRWWFLWLVDFSPSLNSKKTNILKWRLKDKGTIILGEKECPKNVSCMFWGRY